MQLEKLQDQKPECHLEWPKDPCQNAIVRSRKGSIFLLIRKPGFSPAKCSEGFRGFRTSSLNFGACMHAILGIKLDLPARYNKSTLCYGLLRAYRHIHSSIIFISIHALSNIQLTLTLM